MNNPQLVVRSSVLRRKRLEAVLTQEQLAESSGVSIARIRQLEGGRDVAVQPPTAQKLAERLGCSPQEITEVLPAEAAV
jgi:transcriptional regulator with XRE-family HTH domain